MMAGGGQRMNSEQVAGHGPLGVIKPTSPFVGPVGPRMKPRIGGPMPTPGDIPRVGGAMPPPGGAGVSQLPIRRRY